MRYKVLAFALTLFVTFVQIGNSQTTFASITGTVSDPAGAVVPNATITATNVETGIQSTAKSNESGVFTIAQLKEGKYTVRGEAAGFRNFAIEAVSLVARDVRRVDIALQLGDVTTAVEVQRRSNPHRD